MKNKKTLGKQVCTFEVKGYPVSGIELHKALNIKNTYSSWISRQKTELELVEGEDYVLSVTRSRTVNHLLTASSAFNILFEQPTTSVVNSLTEIVLELNEEECFEEIQPENNVIENDKQNNSIIIFNNDLFGEIRTLQIDGKPYFVGKDVAEKLGYKNTSKAINDHCKGVTKRYIVDITGLQQQMSVISEGDLYRLIVKSKLPEAEKFEAWVMEEILPSIRQNGFYATTSTVDAFLNDPDSAMKILAKYKEEREEKERLLSEAKMNEPKLIAYDDFISSNDLFTFATTAKILAIPRTAHSKNFVGKNTLLSWLRRDGILISSGEDRNTPYQSYLNRGWFEVTAAENDRTGKRVTIMVTPKGIEGLYRKYKFDSMPKKIDISSAIEMELDSVI